MFYCSSVWSNISVTNINKLQAIQNFAAPPMTKSKKFDHITPILKPLGWMPFKDQLFYRDALLRVCPGENQAGGDTAQITDFAQT